MSIEAVEVFTSIRENVVARATNVAMNSIAENMKKRVRMPLIIAIQNDITDSETAYLVAVLNKKLNNLTGFNGKEFDEPLDNIGPYGAGVFKCKIVEIEPAKVDSRGFFHRTIGINVMFTPVVDDSKINDLITAAAKDAAAVKDAAAPAK